MTELLGKHAGNNNKNYYLKNKNMKTILSIMSITLGLSLAAQTTITLDVSQDARISWKENAPSVANTNYVNDEGLSTYAWTSSGDTVYYRGLIQFDLSSIPSYATITSATLKLYHNPTSPQGQHSGSNQSCIRPLGSTWDESTVTWNTQPSYDSTNQVLFGASQSATEDFENIDVTALISNIHATPASNNGFVIMLRTEEIFRSLILASSKHPNSNLHPKLVVEYDISAAIDEQNDFYTIFPNPTSDIIQINCNNKISSIQLFDISGKQLLLINDLNTNQTSVDLSNWGSGIYFLNVVDVNGNMKTQRVNVK